MSPATTFTLTILGCCLFVLFAWLYGSPKVRGWIKQFKEHRADKRRERYLTSIRIIRSPTVSWSTYWRRNFHGELYVADYLVGETRHKVGSIDGRRWVHLDTGAPLNKAASKWLRQYIDSARVKSLYDMIQDDIDADRGRRRDR